MHKCEFFVRGANLVEVYTDCPGIPGILNKHMADTKNMRLQRMMEKFSFLNIQAHHVKGHSHQLADGLSRNPLPGSEGEEFPMRMPRIMERSRRIVQMGVDTKDPLVKSIAMEGKKYDKYTKMVQSIKQGLERNELEKDSDFDSYRWKDR